MRHAATLAAVVILTSSSVRAFECGGVAGAIEKAICSDPATKAADDAMVAAFSAVKARSNASEAASLLADQRVWLTDRNKLNCGRVPPAVCLRRADTERTDYLLGRPRAGGGTPDALVPLIVSVKNSATTYAVTVRLLRFANARTPAELLFNRLMTDVVRETPNAIVPEQRGADTSSYYAERSAAIVYASDRLLSVSVGSDNYGGQAHPNSRTEAFNFDMRTGKRLAMDDLVAPEHRPGLIADCSKQVRQQIKDKSRGEDENDKSDTARDQKAMLQDLSDDGLKTVTVDLKNWTFGVDKATVTYDPYAVAPYYMGGFVCELSYDRLRPLTKPDFPLP